MCEDELRLFDNMSIKYVSEVRQKEGGGGGGWIFLS